MKTGMPEMKRAIPARRLAHVRRQCLAMQTATDFPTIKRRRAVQRDDEQSPNRYNFANIDISLFRTSSASNNRF
jgi:hypothetical protein